MNLKNKTVLITGGNSGLGFATAKQLLKKKAKVIILGKDKSKLLYAKKQLKSPLVSFLDCDLRDYQNIKNNLKFLKTLDILINNAGIIANQILEKQDVQNIKDIIDTNLLGTILVTRAVLPLMKKKNSGIILNVSSTAGLKGHYPGHIAYHASKFGVTGFTESLRTELNSENLNIKVIGFYPGGMKTKLFSKAINYKRDISNFMDPNEIAKIVVFMLERPDSIVMDHVVVNRNKNL